MRSRSAGLHCGSPIALGILLLTACGRVGFDPKGDGDAATGGSDAPLGGFGAPMPVPELASSFPDDDAGISSDGLELYFASIRTGTSDIYVSTRSSVDEPWSAPQRVIELSTDSDNEKSPELADGNLTLWFVTSDTSIMVAKRASRGAPWSTPVLALDGNALQLGTPAVCGDGLRMFVRSEAPTPANLMTTARASITDAWPTPELVAELSSPERDSGVFATADCGRVYFDSHRDGENRIYAADLDCTTGTYGPPVDVRGGADFIAGTDPSLTADERILMFTGKVNGVEQIFEARR